MKKITLALAGALLIAASAPAAFAQSYAQPSGQGYGHGYGHEGRHEGRHERREELRREIAALQARMDRVIAQRSEIRERMRAARHGGDIHAMSRLEDRMRMNAREERSLEMSIRQKRRELDRMGR